MKHPKNPKVQHSENVLTVKKPPLPLLKLLEMQRQGQDELDSHELDSRCRHTPLFTVIHHGQAPEVILWDEYDLEHKHDS